MEETDARALCAEVARRAARGERICYAAGICSLVHAGTVRFLAEARSQCDCLVALLLPEPAGAGREAALLRPDERFRVLRALREVDGVAALAEDADPPAENWFAAAPEAAWVCNGAEREDLADLRRILAGRGARLRELHPADSCTTQGLLARILQA